MRKFIEERFLIMLSVILLGMAFISPEYVAQAIYVATAAAIITIDYVTKTSK